MLCRECTVVWCRDLDTTSKNDWKHLRCGMEKDGAYKMDRQNKNAVVLDRVGEGRIILEPIKKRKRN